MDTFRDFLRSKRNIASLLILAFIALSLPLGLYLLKQQQTYKSSAAGELIQLAEGPCIQTINAKKVAICNNIPLKLFNPFASGSASITPTPTSTASASTPSPSPSASVGAPQTIRVNSFTGTAIQAALNSIKSTGGAVYLPAGTYIITEKIRLFSNTTLFGDGMDATHLTFASGVSDDMVANDSSSGQQNIVIRDLSLDGPGPQNYNSSNCCNGVPYGLKLENLNNAFVINVSVDNFPSHGLYIGYKIKSGVPQGVKNARITGCRVNNNGGVGIYLVDTDNVVVDNCTVQNNGAIQPIDGITLGPDNGSIVINSKILSNTVTNNRGNGIGLASCHEAHKDAPVHDIAVCNNIADPNDYAGLRQHKCNAGVYGNIFIGNNDGGEFDNTGNGEILNSPQSACNIPANLNIPAAPAKPAAMRLTPNFLSWLPHFEVEAANATPSASAAPTSTSYRLAETQAGLASAPWVSYSSSPIVTNFTVPNTPGTKEVWVQFINPSGQSLTDHIPAFDLLPPSPTISGVTCGVDLTNKQLKVTINGSNLGTTNGVLSANGTALQVSSWNNTSVVGLLSTPAQEGQKYTILLKRADSLESVPQSCQVNTAALSLGARVFCRAEGQFDISNVDVTIAPLSDPAQKISEKATIDKDGIIQGIKTKLQVDQQYIISVKAPKTLRRNTIITASSGTTVANTKDGKPFILPIGDIAPSTPDGQINGLDRSELVKQWRVLSSSSSAALTADFNRDNKVNSIDWACMKYDFNSKDDDPANPSGSVYTNGLNFSTGQGSLIFSY